jgi:hypothetical protein
MQRRRFSAAAEAAAGGTWWALMPVMMAGLGHSRYFRFCFCEQECHGLVKVPAQAIDLQQGVTGLERSIRRRIFEER